MVSSTEHYAEMAEGYLDLAKRESPISATTILHLGCGGGHADFTLKKNMVVTGVDVSEEMLVEARSLNPEVT
ncbi:class I SAM-dependent methyltransferase, partial [Dehalococcoidia bacterium]|nr:class I SAM-dependent methyltransferase [Dehalococcoidia bacterium]